MNSIKDAHLAYNYVRELVIKDVKNSKLWNLFNIMITDSDDTRHNKFLMRLANKHTDNVAIGILNGNNCLLAGTYKYSLGEYMNVYKIERNNPIVPLMLGITFVHLACQKLSSRKHSLGTIHILRKHFYIAQNLIWLPKFSQKLGVFMKTKEFIFHHYSLTKFSCCDLKF